MLSIVLCAECHRDWKLAIAIRRETGTREGLPSTIQEYDWGLSDNGKEIRAVSLWMRRSVASWETARLMPERGKGPKQIADFLLGAEVLP